jgi:hypothetical protein
VSALGDCLLISLVYSLPRSHPDWPFLSQLSPDVVRSFFISAVKFMSVQSFDAVMSFVEPLDRQSRDCFVDEYESPRSFLGPDFAVFATAILGHLSHLSLLGNLQGVSTRPAAGSDTLDARCLSALHNSYVLCCPI